MVKKLQYFLVVTGLVIAGTAFKGDHKTAANAIRTIVIDPGHGGKDPGCQGVTHKEKDVALAVALRLGKYIEEHLKDVKVIYTRTTDVFVELEDRAQIANKAKADLFISIHCNAAGMPVMIKDPKTGKTRAKMYKNKKGKMVVVEKPNPGPFGTETYVMGLKNEEGKMKVATRENSAIFYEDDYEKKYGGFDPESEESYIIMSNYTSAYVIQSASLAMKMQEEYERKAGRVDKGVHRQSIWVLWRTSMPSILTEIGYLTNPLEEGFLGSEKGQEYLAKAMFRGLRKWKDEVEGTKKDYNDEFENQVALENENIKAGNIPGVKKVVDEPEPEEKETKQEDSIVKKQDTDLTVEIKKPETLEVKTKPATSTQSITVPKQEKVKDIPVAKPAENRPKDSVVKTESAISATLTAARYKFKMDSMAAVKAELEKAKAATTEEVLFKVQFATSDIALNLKQEKFAAIADADFYRVNNTLKYTSGKFSALKDALTHQNQLREKGFKDCFVIAMKNGQRIDLAEARKLLGQ